MASRQGLALAGGAVAAIGGYYLYNAGGSAKVAEKQMERMLHDGWLIVAFLTFPKTMLQGLATRWESREVQRSSPLAPSSVVRRLVTRSTTL